MPEAAPGPVVCEKAEPPYLIVAGCHTFRFLKGGILRRVHAETL